jgi:hypothetical protein
MLPRTIKLVGTTCSWIGFGLIACGVVLPAWAPRDVAGVSSGTEPRARTAPADSGNPDQVLRDEAAAVRRRVEEFRERASAEEGNAAAARVCYGFGALLVLGGLVGRLASERVRKARAPTRTSAPS